jgi:hypothetical protein
MIERFMFGKKNIFLTSTEHTGEWARLRRCSIIGKLADDEGRDYLWVRVDPPVIGQTYGLGEQDLSDLLLLPHFERASLFPISQYPMPVYILRALEQGVFQGLPLSADKLGLAAWGELYDSRRKAEAVAKQNE